MTAETVLIKIRVNINNVNWRWDMKNYIKNMSEEDTVLLNLKRLYDSYGYNKIALPTFDEYDLYNENKDFISGNILTIMNPSGKLLALRPDITLSVAKKISKEQSLKYEKIYYSENVYKASKYKGYEEIEQLGIELIGKDSLFLNFEMINLAIKSLQIINSKCITVLSHVGFASSIFENLNLEYEIQEELLKYIESKNSHDIRRILGNVNIGSDVKELICVLPELSGDLEYIKDRLSGYAVNEKMGKILEELEKLYKLLRKFHGRSKIIFDFSIVKNLNYYNGIIIQGFIEGLPNMILTGGRYDRLFEKFGVDNGAIGFAILTDNLKGYYKDEGKKDFEILLVYDDSNYEKLSEIIDDFIEKGYRVRAEHYKNINDENVELFNFDKQYMFKDGILIE